jgi:alpha-tubulin suppressor-like RCC1 family protein
MLGAVGYRDDAREPLDVFGSMGDAVGFNACAPGRSMTRKLLGALLMLSGACADDGPSGPPLLGVTQVSVGGNHVCALLDDSRVQCWGDTRRSEGSGPAGSPVPDIESVAEVEAGSQHTCVRRDDGSVSCWGYNLHGQLGGGSPVPDIPAADELVVGANKACVLGVGGELWCWGGGFGLSGSDSSPPTSFDLGSPVVDVAPAAGHICALTNAGTLFCWGSNDQDEYGDGAIPETTSPTEITAITGLTGIVEGHQHICALRGGSEVVCWGYTYGSPPVRIEGVPAVTQLAAGQRHSCGLGADHHVYCWGANDRGQLGNGSNEASATAAVQVEGLYDATQISATSDVTCAVRTDTSVVCWGKNTEGRVGDGTTMDRSRPVAVLANP